MSDDAPVHTISMALKEPLQDEFDAGADFAIVIALATSGADLQGTRFKILQLDRVITSGELPVLTGERHDTATITATAPEEVGAFIWTFVLLAHGVDGIHYDESSLSFSFNTRPHPTSLAVWDNPSPVVIGAPFSVKVGAKCAAGCALTGTIVEVRDQTGTAIAAGAFGETPWPGTTALYWTLVEMQAPADEGHFFWSVEFSAKEQRLPHESASASFSFVAIGQPEHAVSVEVVEKDTSTRVPDAQVCLGVYRASTDEAGRAAFVVPAGEHNLSVCKAGHDVPDRTVHVTKGEALRVEIERLPEDDPFAFWQG